MYAFLIFYFFLLHFTMLGKKFSTERITFFILQKIFHFQLDLGIIIIFYNEFK